MGGSGSFPIDLVLFGMIAAFLVLRLRSILGRRTGYERPPQPVAPLPRRRPRAGDRGPCRTAGGAGTRAPAARSGKPRRPGAGADAAIWIAASIRARFLEGAEARVPPDRGRPSPPANRDQLRPLLTADTFAGFEAAIAAREAAG